MVKILIALIVVIAMVLIAAGLYFYNYAVVPGKKDFINENTPGSKVVQTPEGAWFKDDKIDKNGQLLRKMGYV